MIGDLFYVSEYFNKNVEIPKWLKKHVISEKVYLNENVCVLEFKAINGHLDKLYVYGGDVIEFHGKTSNKNTKILVIQGMFRDLFELC